ncbi:hypothetical protein TNCV_2327881 [Trichonephila clavipes]|nr:hypothetical protein TNCV_2327881 [Trichonephila clavipes]
MTCRVSRVVAACPLDEIKSFDEDDSKFLSGYLLILVDVEISLSHLIIEYSILFVFATKVRLSKQQDEDHERYAAQRYPTHVQSVTYPANTQAKEEAVPAANQDRI